jgi:hypothetical protein
MTAEQWITQQQEEEREAGEDKCIPCKPCECPPRGYEVELEKLDQTGGL